MRKGSITVFMAHRSLQSKVRQFACRRYRPRGSLYVGRPTAAKVRRVPGESEMDARGVTGNPRVFAPHKRRRRSAARFDKRRPLRIGLGLRALHRAAPLASTFDESFGCIDPDHRSHLAKPDQATHSRAVTAAQINPFLSFSYSRPFGEINRGPHSSDVNLLTDQELHEVALNPYSAMTSDRPMPSMDFNGLSLRRES